MNIDVTRLKGPCACGREHDIQVKGITVGRGASRELDIALREGALAGLETVIVCDENTKAASMAALEPVFARYPAITLPPEGLHADNRGVDLLEKAIEKLGTLPTLLLAVGSGTIHDLTRYVSSRRGIPFVSVPTAPSVDGFVSTVAAMTWDGMKLTLPAQAPLYVYADTEVFSKAPRRMIATGVGDLMGKYICLCDWKIGHLLTGEYYCEKVVGLEEEALEEVRECLADGSFGDEASCEKLMVALLLSGLAMQMVGNSRPASGAEHHMSHFWEMGVVRPEPAALHGEKVAVGTMLMLERYHGLAQVLRRDDLTVSSWEEVKEAELAVAIDVFGRKGILEAVKRENEPELLEGVSPDGLKKAAKEIAGILDALPSSQEMEALLKACGCPCTVSELGLEEEIIPISIALSPFVRRRLTFNRISKLIQQ